MRRVHLLSEEEMAILERLCRSLKDERLRWRCRMILLSNQGLSPTRIAERVPYGRSTVTRYIQRYEALGLEGLKNRPRPGRPRQVTADYVRQLIEIAQRPPAALGLHFQYWSTARLARHMARRTGIEISARQVENYLKAHGVDFENPRGRRRGTSITRSRPHLGHG